MVVLEVGAAVDALDLDDIWSPGVIIQISDNKALVRYEGWGEEWDEWIGLDKDRLVAGGTYTIKAKCWAKITGTMPWWPALVTIRRSKPGSEHGRQALQQEPRLFVIPVKFPLQPYRDGLWVHFRNISPYCVNTEYRKRVTSQIRYKTQFLEAIAAIEELPNPDINFSLDGSLMTMREPVRRQRPTASESKPRSAKKISPTQKQSLSKEAMQAVTSGRHLLLGKRLEDELKLQPRLEGAAEDDGEQLQDLKYLSQFTRWATSLAGMWERDHPMSASKRGTDASASDGSAKKAKRS